MIYFDNAATSLHKPDTVADAVYHAIHSMGNGGRGSHTPSLQAGRLVYETRVLLAELFHISPNVSTADRIACSCDENTA